MNRPALKLFLTGDPGCGKTTVVRRVVERLRGSVPMTGFWTEDVVVEGRRQGFRGRTVDGAVFALADRSFPGPPNVGPYGVELQGLESTGLESLAGRQATRLIILDEVGKMEAFSVPFQHRVDELLAGEIPILGTVASHGVGFVKRVRGDARIALVRMRRRARDGMVGEVLRRLAEAGIAPEGAMEREPS